MSTQIPKFLLMFIASVILFLFSSFIPGAGQSQDETAWPKGSVEGRFHLVAKHLRGFDMAMVETGHRYAELYWAGKDANWAYADYQLAKDPHNGGERAGTETQTRGVGREISHNGASSSFRGHRAQGFGDVLKSFRRPHGKLQRVP
jgi:hypothetical protein